jgi:hypothetical protein
MDPHCWAKIRTRESLESLEQFARSIDATNAGVSTRAMLLELARLKRRLEWCDSSYSRDRSIRLWMWVVRCVAELLIRWIEISRCLLTSTRSALTLSYDSRTDNPASATVQKTVAGRTCAARTHIGFVPLAA